MLNPTDLDDEAGAALDPEKAVTLELEDGSVEISFGDGPEEPEAEHTQEDFDANLADSIDHTELARISAELLEGIEIDDESRAEWLAQREYGLGLLGLDPRRKDNGADGTSNATITHPLLLESVLRFQANARGELLPVDGPVKVRDDFIMPPQAPPMAPGPAPMGLGMGMAPMGHNGGPPLAGIDDDKLADALEEEFNHYLTAVATEFYPDTDRLLFEVGFSGTGFKKIYHCPLRNRPVSEMVDAKDMIVSNGTVDMRNAARITHVIPMRQPTLRRMQLVGAYRNVDLDPPDETEANPVDAKIAEIQGMDDSGVRLEDRERTVYECYCELDIVGHEHKDAKGELTGLALPYKVTLDKSSREILEIRRNWVPAENAEDHLPLPVAKRVFVKYSFVPGLGFYDIGLLHILGNATRAATASWRISLDAGMRANYPGGFYRKIAGRTTNINFMSQPGDFIPIETGPSGSVADAVMPFPFKGPDGAMMQITQDIVQTAERVGGTAESNVGEGRADAPVGTTLALLEQQRVILDAVHKRMHTAQGEEFSILVERFREHPEALYRSNPKPALGWTEDLVLQALNDHDLVPVADPNTSSHMQRVAKMDALLKLVGAAGPLGPVLFDLAEVAKGSLEAYRLPNYQRYLNPNPPPPDALAQMISKGKGGQGGAPPDPSIGQARLMDAQTKQFQVQHGAKMAEAELQAGVQKDAAAHIIAQGKLQIDAHKVLQGSRGDPNAQLQAHLDVMDAKTRAMDAQTRERALAVKVHDNVIDAQQQAADRQSENSIAALNTMKELAIHHDRLAHDKDALEAQREAAKLAAKSGGSNSK